jgi:hypothetical protein
MLLVCGCGSDETVIGTGAGGGVPDEPPCPAGDLERADGSCQPPGIPPGGCAEGFVEGGDGCEPILPPGKCPAGFMAVPGDAECHEPMPCGEGTWGDIPTDPGTTEHVDPEYAGGDADGSAARPWPTIGEALGAAAPNAIVAVAAGTYEEEVVLDAPVRLWGRCPRLVEIVAQGPELVAVAVLADGVEVRGVSATGVGGGIAAIGASGVIVEGVHVHHTEAFAGVGVFETAPSSLTLRDSLVESCADTGLTLSGGEMIVERTLVRDPTTPVGNALRVVASPGRREAARASVTRSLFEDARLIAVYVAGAEASLHGLVVRDTRPGPTGEGGAALVVRDDPVSAVPTSATLVGSVVEGNHYTAVQGASADLVIERTVIRDTGVQPSDGTGGAAIGVLPIAGGPPTSLEVRESVLARSRFSGVLLAGAPAVLEAVVVREVGADAAGRFGRGVNVEVDPVTLAPASGTLRGVVVEDAREVGVALLGAEASVDGLAVRGVHAQESDGLFGRGISIGGALGAAAHATLSRVEVEGARDCGIHVAGADVSIHGARVLGTAAREADGAFGDGIAVDGEPGATTVALTGVHVEGSARAGVGNFAATVLLEGSSFSCNLVDLNGETLGLGFVFDDRGGNTCGCSPQPQPCRVLSSHLEPPSPPQ